MSAHASSLPEKCILVVDDEPAIRKLLAFALRQQGFHVKQAADGEQAVELFRQYHDDIDVVLLDVRMGRMDGPQTLAQLRQFDDRVRFCFMTGHGGGYSDCELFALGATHIFSKPFGSLDELTRVLRDTVRADCPDGARLQEASSEQDRV